MIVRSTFILFILFIHILNAINPEYFRQYQQEQQLAALIESINKQLNDQHSNFDSSEINEDDDQLVKRNKYPNFHVSPLWLSRRTRTNRFYGKPLWISRTG
jgi:DUF1365 family protein